MKTKHDPLKMMSTTELERWYESEFSRTSEDALYKSSLYFSQFLLRRWQTNGRPSNANTIAMYLPRGHKFRV